MFYYLKGRAAHLAPNLAVIDLWRKETEGIHSFYAQFGDKLPQALREELAGLEDRLKD